MIKNCWKKHSLVRSVACICTYRKILHKYYLFQVNNEIKSILKLYYQENILCNENILHNRYTKEEK